MAEHDERTTVLFDLPDFTDSRTATSEVSSFNRNCPGQRAWLVV
jgi:hypothetical protein